MAYIYKDIFEAASSNNFTAVRHFIEVDGINPNVTNSDGDTVAHIAAQNDYLTMVKYLLEKDQNLLKKRGHQQITIFEIAVAINSLPLVKYLVNDCKLDILQAHSDCPPDTYVHLAAEMGNLEVFRYFIEEKKVDVNLKNALGQSPAFAAARESCLNIIEYIIEVCEGDVTTTDSENRNILCQCAKNCDLLVPKYLLDTKKLDIDINNTFILEDAITSVKDSKSHDELQKFIRYFVEEKRMNINADMGATPLHHAAERGMLDIVQYLVLHGINVRKEDSMGRIPSQVSTDKDVVNFLLGVLASRVPRSPSKFLTQMIVQPDYDLSAFNHLQGMIRGSSLPLLVGHPTYVGIQHFLIFVNAYYSSRFKKNVYDHLSHSSPPNIIKSRIDPVAMTAIHDYWRNK